MIKRQNLCSQIKGLRHYVRGIARKLGYLDSKLSHVNVTMPQLHALIEIDKHKTLTVAKLAKILNLNQSSTCRTITSLKKLKLVKTIMLSNDKKQKPVELTLLGKEKVKEINNYCGSFYEKALEQIPKEKHSSILEAFKLYAEALSNIN